MIRQLSIRIHAVKTGLATTSVFAMLVLSGCMSANQQAALPGNEDVVAIVPPSNGKTASLPAGSAASPAEPLVRSASTSANPSGPLSSEGQVAALPADPQAGDQGSALGIMQSTRVQASSGSIFSSVVADPSDPNAIAAPGRSVKPIQSSLFSANAPQVEPPVIAQKPVAPGQQASIIVPPSADVPENSPDYDAGIIVINKQTDEQRRIMSDKNDLVRNANPEVRAMEPDSRAAPANQRTASAKPKKKGFSLPDLFGGLGRNGKK